MASSTTAVMPSLKELERVMLAEAQVQDAVVPIVYRLVERLPHLIEQETSNPTRTMDPDLQVFNSGTVPPINLNRLIGRIVKYGGCSRCNIVIGLIYLERLKEKKPLLLLTSQNCVKLFLIAVMISTKFWEDSGFLNAHWADIAGLTLQEINELELAFIFTMEFDFALSKEEYKEYICFLLDRDLQLQVTNVSTSSADGLLSKAGTAEDRLFGTNHKRKPLQTSLLSNPQSESPDSCTDPQCNRPKSRHSRLRKLFKAFNFRNSDPALAQ